MSKYFLVGQSTYTKKDTKEVVVVTTFKDERGQVVNSYSLPAIDPAKLPKLPEVKLVMEAGTVFDNRVTSKITGITFV